MTWTDIKIKAFLDSLSIPYSYYQFPEGTAQEPPFICFWYPESNNFYADDTVYVRRKHLRMELYTDRKDWDLEAQVESALIENELAFEKEETYLESERMYLETYDMMALFDAP